MTPLPSPPPEPPRITSLDGVAPKVRDAVLATIDDLKAIGLSAYVFESLRTDERQSWLFGLGREYEYPGDPPEIVTNAQTGDFSWHKYGLAVDVAWNGRVDWYRLGKLGKLRGLAWGGDWPRFTDQPHLQWGTLRPSPSSRAVELFASGGFEAVWREVGAL